MQWEYKIEEDPEKGLGAARVNETLLNKMGQLGWELVAAVSVTTPNGTWYIKYIFKRPKP